MCSNVTTTCPPSLQQLSKLTVLPTRSSELSASLAFLQTIDHVEIKDATERDGVVYYHMDVFLTHSTSHIPTIKSTAVSDRPDYQLERRFSAFANLRYEVWMYVQRQHEDGHRCKYCGAFMSYIVHSMSQPRALVKLATGVNTRKKLLAAFCNAFVEKTLGHKTDLRQRDTVCTGYQTIPRVVEDFFRQD
ncbi:hypothetical protein PHYPSEUDO_002567 [Phytophthora pseudosyringae]|uniref:PX domain-containing protein n=1 Tax=Phytophthora pseudosyringae TaxID=221518 RepID=A0A8T1VSP4_9STRA|nr:hypothetical protein PHYPSEUDO_002567 [Phytophthora pseudosyringae]